MHGENSFDPSRSELVLERTVAPLVLLNQEIDHLLRARLPVARLSGHEDWPSASVTDGIGWRDEGGDGRDQHLVVRLNASSCKQSNAQHSSAIDLAHRVLRAYVSREFLFRSTKTSTEDTHSISRHSLMSTVRCRGLRRRRRGSSLSLRELRVQTA